MAKKCLLMMDKKKLLKVIIPIKFDMYSHKDTGEHVFTVHQVGLTEDQMRAILVDMEVDE